MAWSSRRPDRPTRQRQDHLVKVCFSQIAVAQQPLTDVRLVLEGRKSGHAGRPDGAKARNRCAIARRARPNRERSHQRRELLSLNQLCQRNCCGLRAEPCEITTLTRAGPRKLIASSRAPRRSFGSSTKKPLPPNASMTLSYRAPKSVRWASC